MPGNRVKVWLSPAVRRHVERAAATSGLDLRTWAAHALLDAALGAAVEAERDDVELRRWNEFVSRAGREGARTEVPGGPGPMPRGTVCTVDGWPGDVVVYEDAAAMPPTWRPGVEALLIPVMSSGGAFGVPLTEDDPIRGHLRVGGMAAVPRAAVSATASRLGQLTCRRLYEETVLQSKWRAWAYRHRR
ncbi:hypothetical protein LX16_3774 [Stackebrandtia albiflava]|uniref:Uncharacterized protein n=1 Tax=Stackebrandtia albiflava TaxID=406432 RepID=A0A562V5D0_9ACTN|nr:hypothetical protein [Stackebrandtia albiflava]TWJ13007.1 hypothetical protein LX16_3774 [Stackebrandtia albiflava]